MPTRTLKGIWYFAVLFFGILLSAGLYRAVRDVLAPAPSTVHAQTPPACPFTNPITLTLAGNTQVIASPAGAVMVCHISFSTTAAETVQLRQGAGGCGGATTPISGVYQSVQSLALDFPLSPLRVAQGNALCLNQQNAQNLGGLVEWGNLF